MGFERVARVAEVPEGSGLCVTRGELKIGIYRVGKAFYAMENVCPHAGFPLSEGALQGTLICCPGHGWEFDVATGLAPGEVDEEPLARYPVRVEGNDLLIDVDRRY